MTRRSGYNSAVKRPVQRSIPILLALFGTLLLLSLVSRSLAQISSSNSSGSGHSVSVAPPTASIAPPTGSIAPPTGVSSIHSGFVPSDPGITHFPGSSHNPDGHHQFHQSTNGTAYYAYPYLYPVPVPYAADATDADTSEDDDPEYQGGPTVFDRRGSGAASYVPPSYEGPAHVQDPSSQDSSAAQSSADLAPESSQSPTILVFKDGHQLQVDNYAIVGQTLYDLTPGHARKIALADLDLPATEKQNDDRGVTFQLPPSAQGS